MWNLNSHKAEDVADDEVNNKGRNRSGRGKDSRKEHETRRDRKNGMAVAKRGRVGFKF